MTERTITQNGMFGEITLTKEEFIKRWTDHVSQLYRLSYEQEWETFVKATLDVVEHKASLEFNEIWLSQQRGIEA